MMYLRHAPVRIDGHMFLYDPPWFATKEESVEYGNNFVAWARAQIQ